MPATLEQSRSLYGNPEQFDAELTRRGLKDHYTGLSNAFPDSDEIKDLMRKDLFLSDLGADPQAIRDGRAEMGFAEQLGEEGPFEPKEFNRKAAAYLDYEQTKEDASKEGFRMGLESIIDSEDGGAEAFRKWNEGQTDEVIKSNGRKAFIQGRQRFGAHVPYMKTAKQIRDAVMDGGVFDPSSVDDDLLAEFGKMGKDDLNKVLESIAIIENIEGTDRDKGFFAEGFQNVGRLLRGFGRTSGQFAIGNEAERQIQDFMGAEKLYVAAGKDWTEEILNGRVKTSLPKERRGGTPQVVELTPEQMKDARKMFEVQKGAIRLIRQSGDIREQIQPLLDDNFWEKAFKITQDSVGYIGASLNPATAGGVLAPNFIAQRDAELELMAPDMDLETRQSIATVSGVVETGVARAEGMILFAKIPGVSKALQGLKHGKALDVIARTAVMLPVEVAQEYVEEQSLNLVLEAADAMGIEAPDAQFAETTRQFADQLGVMSVGMLPLVALGAGISVNMDSKMAAQMEPYLQMNLLELSGFTKPEVETILAEEGPLSQSKKAGEIAEEKGQEQMAADRGTALEDEQLVAAAEEELAEILGVTGDEDAASEAAWEAEQRFLAEEINPNGEETIGEYNDRIKREKRQASNNGRGNGSAARLQQRENYRRHDVIASIIDDHGGLISASRMNREDKARFGRLKGEYNGATKLRNPLHNIIYAKKGGMTPDVMAQELFNDGKISEPTADAMWEAVNQAAESMNNNSRERDAEYPFMDEADAPEFSIKEETVLHSGGRLPFTDKLPGFKWLARKLRARGKLHEDAFAAQVAGEGEQRAIIHEANQNRRQLEALVDKAAKLTEGGPLEARKQRIHRQVKKVLVGEAELNTLPEELREITTTIRAHVDKLSETLESAGFVSGDLADIVLSNRGTYMNRSYRRFDDAAKWSKQVTEPVKEAARKELREQYPKRDGETASAYKNRIEGVIESLLNSDADSPSAAAGKTKLGRHNLGNLKKREDIPKWLRNLWGERDQANEVYFRTVHKMAHQIGNHRFLTQTRNAGMGKFLFEADPDTGKSPNPDFPVQISAEGNKALAPLDGLFTSREIAEAFNSLSGMDTAGWVKVLVTANAYAKFSKTILSPITHVRNFVSNPSFLLANGNLHGFMESGKSVKSMVVELLPHSVTEKLMGKEGAEETSAYVRKLIRLGVLQDSAHGGELQAVLNDSVVGEMDMAEYSDHMLKRAVKRSGQVFIDLYQAEDAFWKVLNFEAERAKYAKAKPDWTADQVDNIAAEITRNQMPTYSLVPEGVKDLRRFPFLGNFVSFTSEVIRNNYNIARRIKQEMGDPDLRGIGAKRAAGFMAAHSAHVILAAMFRSFLGVDDEDEDAVRALAAPWDVDSQLLFLPSEEGSPKFINLSYSDPFAMFKQMPIAFINEDDPVVAAGTAFHAVFEPFVAEEMTASAVIDIMRNTPKEGGDVYDEFAPPNEQLAAMTAHVVEAMKPNIINQGERVFNAATDRKKGSRSYDLGDEMTSLLTGQRIVEVDPPNALFWKSRSFSSDKRNAVTQFTRKARESGKVTDKELRKAYTNMLRARKRIYEDYQDVLLACEHLGMSREEIEETAATAKAGKADVAALIDGEIPAWGMSSDLEKRVEDIDGREEQLRRVVPELFANSE